MSSTLGIWVVRKEARELGRLLEDQLGGKLGGLDCGAGQSENRRAFTASFSDYPRWILVMAAGIAIRYLEGLTRHKSVDPGVVVIDEGRRFAIALLGGHEGGANALAYQVANVTGAIPVVTTATEALKPLILGIGCRKGVSAEQIGHAVTAALSMVSRSPEEIREVATIDLKGDEKGLIQWCGNLNLPLRLIPLSLIRERPWVSGSSRLVHSYLGIGGVCEPCALLATFRGHLILRKTTRNGVAVALAEERSGR